MKKYYKTLLLFFLILIPIFSYKVINNKESKFYDCELFFKENINSNNMLECYIDKAVSLSNDKSPDYALKIFKNYALGNKNKNFNIACHDILHEIGKEFYKVHKNNALVPNNEICLFGYYHGVFQKNSELKINNYSFIVNSICEGKINDARNLCLGSVSHGYGHAIASNNSILKSLDICEQISNDNNINIEKENCAYGVIMESEQNNKIDIQINDCVKKYSTSISRGCVIGLAPQSIKTLKNFSDSCPNKLLDDLIIDKCYRGIGFVLASNLIYNLTHNISNSIYLSKMIEKCSITEECSSGAGSILVTSLRDLSYVVNICDKYFSEICKLEAKKIAKLESIQ
jgi:hypothetical protein